MREVIDTAAARDLVLELHQARHHLPGYPPGCLPATCALLSWSHLPRPGSQIAAGCTSPCGGHAGRNTNPIRQSDTHTALSDTPIRHPDPTPVSDTRNRHICRLPIRRSIPGVQAVALADRALVPLPDVQALRIVILVRV